MRTALLVLLCVTFAFAQSDFSFVSPIGVAGNGTIWYQPSNFFALGNVQNPVTVQITYASGQTNAQASICLNTDASNLPVPGVNLAANCPAGGYGTASNATDAQLATPPASKLGKFSNSKSQFIGARMALSDDSDFDTSTTVAASLYVKPTNGATAGFVVSLPDVEAQNQQFQITVSGKQCAAGSYPVGASNACSPIDPLPTTTTLPLEAGQIVYYQYVVYSNALPNTLAVSINGTDDGAAVWIQADYYPTADWYLNAQEDENDGTTTYTITTPGFVNQDQTFFFAVTNTGDESLTVYLNSSTTTCTAANTFGYNCQHTTTNTTDPLAGYAKLNATLINGPAASNQNNGTAWSFDYSDSDNEGDYAYFSLVSYPDGTLVAPPYYIRVTVAANDNEDAPGFFAKKGGYPSAQSNFYNVSTSDDVSHQIVIPITQNDIDNQADPDYVWYFAVQLPADFSIWVASNCAGNCSEGAHGTCYCGTQTCEVATSNFENPAPFYTLPTSLQDSAGACTCEDDSYDESFDCSTKNNPYLWLWILLIVIAIVVVVVIAVAVPAFFIYQQRQKRRSGYDVVDDGYQ